MFKSKGPKIDPCETPLSTFPHSLQELFIYNVEVYLWDSFS